MKRRSNNNYRDENFTPVGNEEFAIAMREKRRSNATSRHLSAEQKRTRTQAKHLALRDQNY